LTADLELDRRMPLGTAKGLSILYLGQNSGTSGHRVLALRRLGHQVLVIDPRQFLPGNKAIDYWLHHTGALLLGGWIRQRVIQTIGSLEFDVTLVNGGPLVSESLVKELRRRYGPVINYHNDDPFGGRDGDKWRLYLNTLPWYDLAVVVRECNVPEALSAGAREAFRVLMSADELAHAPRPIGEEEQLRWASEVAFIGTWMPERGPFLARLVELGVPLTIYGDRWNKAPEWSLLAAHWRGPGLWNDNDYARAVQCAKVCLGLLSKANRDQVTQRSFEIPLLGGVLCAERTAEHLGLYEENTDAVFWSTAEECAEQCHRLLADEEWRRQVAQSGRARCLANRTTNEHVLASILEQVPLNRKHGASRNPSDHLTDVRIDSLGLSVNRSVSENCKE
jgi:spore maturation protein CgeB